MCLSNLAIEPLVDSNNTYNMNILPVKRYLQLLPFRLVTQYNLIFIPQLY